MLPVRPDVVTAYVDRVAARSPRVRVETIGHSHQGRPLQLVSIASPDAWRRIDGGEPPALVVWLTFGVHGDELSTVDAALLLLEQLATTEAPELVALLDEVFVQLVPVVNPDGHARTVNWLLQHASLQPVADPQHAEHTLGWPRGRFNHYGFDLNRQWLVASQPEISALLHHYHRWQPHLVADFHEMLIQWPYYFSPGIAGRENPWTPAAATALQQRFAEALASHFDARGELYFSGEFFDDFSPAMGSTYPNLVGGIGLLLENRGFAGRVIETPQGSETLAARILRHRDAALALLAAAQRELPALQAHRRSFLEQTAALSRAAGERGYLVASPGDPERLRLLQQILARHGLSVYGLRGQVRAGSVDFDPAHSLFVPLAQPGYRLVRNLFEPLTGFDTPVFYDSPAWSLPQALNLEVAGARVPVASRTSPEAALAEPRMPAAQDAYALLIDWREHHAPRALARLLQAGGQARLLHEPVRVQTRDGLREFPAGLVVLPRGEGQTLSGERLAAVLATIAREDRVSVHATDSGRSAEGPWLGSRLATAATLPSVLLLRGRGLNATETGELWHLLDREAGLAVSLRDIEDVAALDLSRYSHVVLPDGDYSRVAQGFADGLGDWVQRGGVLLAVRRAARWVQAQALLPTVAEPEVTTPTRLPRADYADKEALEAQGRIAGAILAADVDITHPLGAGLPARRLPMHRSSAEPLRHGGGRFATVVEYLDEPPIAGLIDAEVMPRLVGTPALTAERVGHGSVILYAENPDFRGYWHGTHRLLMNALYFGRSFLPEGRRFSE